MARWIETNDLRKIAESLHTAGWADVADQVEEAYPALLAAADEIDKLRAFVRLGFEGDK